MSAFVSLLGLVAWALWGYTVIYMDPETPLAALPFYGALFVAVTCTLARLRETPGYERVDGVRVPAKPSLAHGASATTLLLFALWLQSLRMLTPLNAILLAMAMFFIEVGFLLTSRQSRRARRRRPRRPPAVSAAPSAER